MDPYEATKIVFSRIQHLDPENASKIMGLLLIQDHGEKEMIRLAFGPENLLQSLVLKARQELGISPNPPSTPSTPISVSRQSSISSNSNSSRLFLPNGLKIPSSLSIPSLGSPSSQSSFPDFQNPDELISPISSADLMGPGFLNHSPWGPHRRSSSVSDISLEDDPAGGGLGWNNCLYFARGYCKNGSSCRFSHDGTGDSEFGFGSGVGSPSKVEVMEQCHELLRSKSLQHQRMMAANAHSLPYSGNKFLSFLAQQQKNESQRAAAAVMMGEDINKFSRSRFSRSDHMVNGCLGEWSPSSRQIYLTFPADSTFREEDVSDYFSNFGPVQDVRIPYQQKRMFGFVTFVYPETVKIILAKGNPHFVCDSRVLVKPYKEKGKVPDKFRKQQQQLQQMERGEFSTCGSPTALDPFDNQLGSRMMYNNTQELLWRRKLEEETELQQALELQSRRLMGLQLDLKGSRHHHHRALSAGAAPFPSPTYTPNYTQPLTVPNEPPNYTQPLNVPNEPRENGSSQAAATRVEPPQQTVNETEGEKEGSSKDDSNGKESPLSNEESSLPESLEHYLPDSPFASPTKGTAKRLSAFTNAEHGIPVPASSSFRSSSVLPSASSFDLSPYQSCCFQMPRFPTGPGAIGM